MKIDLKKEEIILLEKAGIDYNPEMDFDDDSALALLDRIYDKEVFYAQDSDKNESSRLFAEQYARLADKVHDLIPE